MRLSKASRRRPQVRDHLRDLIDGLGPSMFVGLLTREGILIEANLPGLVAAGLRPEDVLGKPFDETFWWTASPEAQRDLRVAMARAAAGEASRYDVQLRAAGDALIDVDFSLQPLRDEKGEVLFLVPSAIVITERKRAEAALRTSEVEQRALVALLQAEKARLVAAQSLLHTAGRLSRMGAWSVDLPGLGLTWSDEVCAIHEMPAGFAPTVAEAIQFYAQESRGAIADAVGTCMRDGTPFDLELQILTSSGRRVWVRSIGEAERDAAGAIDRIQGSFHDISDRKHAAEELRLLAERLTITLDSITDGLFTVDRQWRFTSLNAEAERLLERTRADLLGKELWVEFPAALGTTFELEYRSAMAHGHTAVFEAFYAPLAAWRSVRAYPSELGLAVYFRDISQDKWAADALQASMEEFRALAEAMPQMVWISRPDGWNVYFNQQWMDYTGLTLAESLGHGWGKALHADDRERAQAAWVHAAATVTMHTLECRLRRADGAYRWWLIRAVPVRDAAGTVLKWFGTCTDVHDLKQAAQAVSESEERFATVFQSNLLALGIADTATGRFVDVNSRAEEFFGYTRDEMIGHTVGELKLWVEPLDRERLIAQMSASASTARGEVSFRRKNGEIRHALVSMEALRLAGIREPLVVSGIVDITERKQLELQLMHAQKMEAMGRLAGGVAHDFNNSLGVIMGYAEMLLRTADASQRSRLEQILKATEHASALTRQLLAFSRKQVVDPKVMDLNALVVDVERMLGRLIGEHVDLAIVPGADLGLVRADPGQVEQVVVNLCVNARDAMPDGGLLRIETANVLLDAAQVAAHEPMAPGRYVALSVTDNGCGMDEQTMSKIYEPFFTTKEQGKGTGLGLAMVYGIAQQAGGDVWVSSQPGRGSTFTVYLPRIDAVAVPSAAKTPPPAGGSETILLVEDEAALRAIARETLEEHGYRVLEAGSAPEAMQVASWHPGPISLLITDVVMPGANGRMLTEALVDVRPGLRTLYISGYTDDVLAHRGVLDSGTLLLEKPFTAHALLARVREALDEARVSP